MKRALGVCYYPEHWPQEMWAEDARRMVDAGLSWVRIAEFAWSRMEPEPGRLELDWLDQAIDTLGSAGLKIVFGTPTATPPRWMIDRHPDMLAVDANGTPRKFGSRRHYCFSHKGYQEECARIVEVLARRYGANPHIAAWQTDNEYGCHETVLSYSKAAHEGFRNWCAQQYQSVDALNRAWGNVFWSMELASFEELELPNQTVTEANPAHRMAFRRFASSEVVRFNRLQCRILRQHSRAPLLHNYMGQSTSFDHFECGQDLDIASWDSYPLGFLINRTDYDDDHKKRYLRQGDPDFQAFHHDLYRAVGRGRWWVMEQQPGPVNWAQWNVAPLPGMARLWAWEAFAHGAEVVSYFRWRQAPFAQEQMHAGLLRPDSAAAPALGEAAQVAAELAEMPDAGTAQAKVAIVFDYPSVWAWEVQPQGQDFSGFKLLFDMYRGLRALGQDIDILPPDASDLSAYELVVIPGLFTLSDGLRAALAAYKGYVLHGPRSGVRNKDFCIPAGLGPDLPGVTATLARSESLPPFAPMKLAAPGNFVKWFDHLEADPQQVAEATADGQPALLRAGNVYCLAGWPDPEACQRILKNLLAEAGLEAAEMPEGLRQRSTQSHRFFFNYADGPIEWQGRSIPAAGVYWQSLADDRSGSANA
ncbi:MAG: beta-galactosidase [Hyphomicrobiales bacterium]|nr:beta-galactosidase [Hyphomicrobiales bacterium]